MLGSFVFVFRLSLLSLLCSCAHRWVPVSFPFTCACWGIARWVLLLLLFSSYSFRFFFQFGFPCDDVASCRLEFYKSRLSVCTVCRWLELGGYVQCDKYTAIDRASASSMCCLYLRARKIGRFTRILRLNNTRPAANEKQKVKNIYSVVCEWKLFAMGSICE